MTAQLSPAPVFSSRDNFGFPLVDGKLFTYAAGTTTPQATYVDSTQTTQNTNPVVLNYRGEAFVWLNPLLAYKFVLQDAFGNQIWTEDNIQGAIGVASNITPSITNTFTLGTPTITFANAYFGPNGAPVFDPVSGNIGYYARTAAEIAASVTPVNYAYAPGDSRRLAPDTTGATDVTVKLQNLLDVAGIAALDGEVREVILQPGTYKVTRLYMHYSNVHLRLMPGTTIVQTLTGITNNNTTGQAPAYAVIHINPLTYVNNPSSGAAGTITNVRIYGGGIVQGPNSVTPGSYQQFQLGIVANDCQNCWVDRITVQGCGAENILMGNSAWNTCTNLKITNCEVLNGGETAINNCRASLIAGNYIHDSWFQNGLGGGGDGLKIIYNTVRNMSNAGVDFGGSGAHDINSCRDCLFAFNVVTDTGISVNTGYQAFFTDDGATTVPKTNIKIIGNIFDRHNGPISVSTDYNSGTIEFENNIISGNLTGGANGIDFSVIAGSATFHLRDNTMSPGPTGNGAYGISISATTCSVVVEESNEIYGHSTADINTASSTLVLKGEMDVSLTLTLTGFAAGQNVPMVIVKKGSVVVINFSGAGATSNSTTMTLGTLPVYLRPTRSQNFRFPVIDNGVNLDGLLQIASTGVMTFFKDINGSAFTNSGTKGLVGPYNITYLLT